MKTIVVVVAAVLAALAHAALAPSKEGARARLTAPLRLDARPGTTIRVDWRVDVPDGEGGREPFAACGMFVRLLSRTGRPSTDGLANRVDCSGPYSADLRVPDGGIGGVRVGLRGTTDIFFPLENDPFMSRRGARCDVGALRATLTAFARAYNSGDVRRLDRLFSRERFVWYSSPAPGRRVRAAAASRGTLRSYFRLRHRLGDRLTLLGYRYNTYARTREFGHFDFVGRRRADDFRSGRWFRFTAKGALDCAERRVTIAVMSLGSPR